MNTHESKNDTLVITMNDNFCLSYRSQKFYSLATMLSRYDSLFAAPSRKDKYRHTFLSNHINSDKRIKLATKVDNLESIFQYKSAESKNGKIEDKVDQVSFFSGLFIELKKQIEVSEHSLCDKAVITLPAQMALLNSDTLESKYSSEFSLWDKELVATIEKAAGIAGFSQILVTGYATPLVKYAFKDANSIVDGQYVFVVEVTNSGFILCPVSYYDIHCETERLTKLYKDCIFIPLDVRKWFKDQVDSKPSELRYHPYYQLEDETHKIHYIDQLLEQQNNNSDSIIPMRELAPKLLGSLKTILKEKLKISGIESSEIDPLDQSQKERSLDKYDYLFDDESQYRNFFKRFCIKKGQLNEDFVPHVIVTGAMVGNDLLSSVFRELFTSFFRDPKKKEASLCEVMSYDEVAKAAREFAINNPKFEYSPGYKIFDEVQITFPQSTKDQKQPISLRNTERLMLIRRLVPDVSKSGSQLTLNIRCTGIGSHLKGIFDFRLEQWHFGSRVEAELVVDSGDRLILSTYLNGEPFEVHLPNAEEFPFNILRLSPGVYEIFCSDEHKLHWEIMTKDSTLS